MEGIRIIELPAATMATSGNQDLNAFDQWWSAVDGQRVYDAVKEWVSVTSDAAFRAMGYRQLDLYIPITVLE